MLLTRTADGTEVADFEFGFTLGQKAVVTTDDDGTLYIEGLAADFDTDRQEEAFEPGAFEAGIKSYLTSNPILLYHHKPDTALGRVVDAKLTNEGLHVKAQVDAPEPGTNIADYVRKIKNGTIRAFSVGGKFYRHMTENGPKIFKCDLGEISVTPYPVNPRTLFSIAGKAFEEGSTPPIIGNVVLHDPLPEAELAARLERIDAVIAGVEGKAQRGGGRSNTLASGASGPGGGGGSAGGGSSDRGGPNPQTATVRARGAGQGHPDRAPVAELLMHMQKVHTLATDVHQNASDPEVQQVANDAIKSAAKHASKLHSIAARIGPLPSYYSGLT